MCPCPRGIILLIILIKQALNQKCQFCGTLLYSLPESPTLHARNGKACSPSAFRSI